MLITIGDVTDIFAILQVMMLYRVVVTFKSMDETLVCDHLNESY